MHDLWSDEKRMKMDFVNSHQPEYTYVKDLPVGKAARTESGTLWIRVDQDHWIHIYREQIGIEHASYWAGPVGSRQRLMEKGEQVTLTF